MEKYYVELINKYVNGPPSRFVPFEEAVDTGCDICHCTSNEMNGYIAFNSNFNINLCKNCYQDCPSKELKSICDYNRYGSLKNAKSHECNKSYYNSNREISIMAICPNDVLCEYHLSCLRMSQKRTDQEWYEKYKLHTIGLSVITPEDKFIHMENIYIPYSLPACDLNHMWLKIPDLPHIRELLTECYNSDTFIWDELFCINGSECITSDALALYNIRLFDWIPFQKSSVDGQEEYFFVNINQKSPEYNYIMTGMLSDNALHIQTHTIGVETILEKFKEQGVNATFNELHND
jgi:hypothetical protein